MDICNSVVHVLDKIVQNVGTTYQLYLLAYKHHNTQIMYRYDVDIYNTSWLIVVGGFLAILLPRLSRSIQRIYYIDLTTSWSRNSHSWSISGSRNGSRWWWASCNERPDGNLADRTVSSAHTGVWSYANLESVLPGHLRS